MDDRLQRLRDLADAEPDDALARFLLGREAVKQGCFEEARAAFAAAVERDPKYSAAYRHWGNALERLGRYEEAAAVYARGARVAERAGDLQAGKEMRAFLKRLERDRGVRAPGEEGGAETA
jgi:tetratricopeptide (TPR) repeat protein